VHPYPRGILFTPITYRILIRESSDDLASAMWMSWSTYHLARGQSCEGGAEGSWSKPGIRGTGNEIYEPYEIYTIPAKRKSYTGSD